MNTVMWLVIEVNYETCTCQLDEQMQSKVMSGSLWGVGDIVSANKKNHQWRLWGGLKAIGCVWLLFFFFFSVWIH